MSATRLKGWITTKRVQKNVTFLRITNGLTSHQATIQSTNLNRLDLSKKINMGSSVELIGKFVEAPLESKEKMEFGVDDVVLLGDADPNVSDFFIIS
jgi:aspartyl/asparaginyl-tRNA synthetase